MIKLELNLVGCLIMIGCSIVIGSVIFKEHEEKKELVNEVIHLKEKVYSK